MKVLITGVDGYIGWSLALYLANRGHEIAGIDNFLRRSMVEEVGSQSAIPVPDIAQRKIEFNKKFNQDLAFYHGDLSDKDVIYNAIDDFKPDTIVYLGQIPSAPYSMIDLDHASFTQMNNIIGHLNTLYAVKERVPDCHIVKLGSLGEYALCNLDIPEGYYDEIEFRGRVDKHLPAFKQTVSMYHNSKIFDTYNLEMMCRFWGIRATDIMQGVVYGTRIDEMGDNENLLTRFDFDQCFGTAINRFCAQATIGIPLTVYGKGTQQRGFIPLKDSVKCLALAIENPAEPGQHRVFNQFEEAYSINDLAEKVQTIGAEFGLNVSIDHIDNPRQEREEHYYNPDHQGLFDLGYKPLNDMDAELRLMFNDLIKNRERIESCKESNFPKSYWHKEE